MLNINPPNRCSLPIKMEFNSVLCLVLVYVSTITIKNTALCKHHKVTALLYSIHPWNNLVEDWTGVNWIGKTRICKTRICKTKTCKLGFVERGFVKHGLVKRGFVKRGLVKQRFVKRALVKRRLDISLYYTQYANIVDLTNERRQRKHKRRTTLEPN